jgi:hypothetical protein
MSYPRGVWPLVALVAVLITGSIWGVVQYRERRIPTAALVKRLPSRDALILQVDFDALRRAGILGLLESSRAGEDPDYQRFVKKTNFDYRQDLDSAVVAFAPGGKYMLVRGRFDWKSLHEYVREQGGGCSSAFCRMLGSAPDRQISFFRINSALMGLAVSPDDYAAARLQSAPSGPDPEVPNDPIWLWIPPSLLRSSELPSGTHMFAHTMEQAERVTLALSADGPHLAARLDVLCRNEQDASEVAAQLSKVTRTLREMIEREHQKPNAADLSGVLTSGSFRSEGRRVLGYWPIERSFVENILGGGGAG